MNVSRHTASFLVAAVMLGASGCASHRVSSNVESASSAALPASHAVVISEDAMPGRQYREVGPMEVAVKKLTLFHANPTREQANTALIEKARAIGA